MTLKNPGSGRVMAKCGLRREGRPAPGRPQQPGIVDAVVYSTLAEEFQACASLSVPESLFR